MKTMIYCFEHEDMFPLEENIEAECVGHYYSSRISLDGVSFEDGEFCCTLKGYAYCPPPAPLFSDTLDYVKTDEWKKWCEENQPDYDEQLVMDFQAISLLDELEQK